MCGSELWLVSWIMDLVTIWYGHMLGIVEEKHM